MKAYKNISMPDEVTGLKAWPRLREFSLGPVHMGRHQSGQFLLECRM